MKNFCVIGLGKFGMSVAKSLIQNGADVMAIDTDGDKIKEMSDFTENAMALDSTDVKALREAGIIGIDVVIVSIGTNIESSILTVMALKDLNNKIIIAKAINPLHGEVLAKIGAFKVVYPEREVAKRLARDLMDRTTFDVLDLSNTIKIVKFLAPKSLIGKTLEYIQKSKDYEVSVIAHKTNSIWKSKNLDLQTTIKENDLIAIIGTQKNIEGFYRFI